MGWIGDDSDRGQVCQAWTAVGLPNELPNIAVYCQYTTQEPLRFPGRVSIFNLCSRANVQCPWNLLMVCHVWQSCRLSVQHPTESKQSPAVGHQKPLPEAGRCHYSGQPCCEAFYNKASVRAITARRTGTVISVMCGCRLSKLLYIDAVGGCQCSKRRWYLLFTWLWPEISLVLMLCHLKLAQSMAPYLTASH